MGFMDYVIEIRKLIGSRPFILVGSTIIVKNDEEKILLQLRSDTLEWGLPGGAMEPGESLEETVKRELLEETGLCAKRYQLLDILSGNHLYFKYPNGDEVFNVIAVFIVKDVYGTLRINDDEGLQLNYFSIDKLPGNLDARAKLIVNEYL
jgi:8-oxo-dGTP pyrophosphatase MutT (NUDIX family)